MAVLSEADRRAAARLAARELFSPEVVANLDLDEIYQMICGIDDFFDANAAAINAAIPADIRGKATLPQKGIGVGIVAMKRAGVI